MVCGVGSAFACLQVCELGVRFGLLGNTRSRQACFCFEELVKGYGGGEFEVNFISTDRAQYTGAGDNEETRSLGVTGSSYFNLRLLLAEQVRGAGSISFQVIRVANSIRVESTSKYTRAGGHAKLYDFMTNGHHLTPQRLVVFDE